MRIATVAYLHGSGGAERQILMLSNAMAEKGHEVHLIILNENKSYYKKSNLLIVHDLTKQEKASFRIFSRWLLLFKELRRIRPTITINYNFQSVYFESLMNKKITGKVLYSERGDPYDKEYSGLLGFLRFCSFKRTDAFVFQSEGARDFFDEKIRKRSAVIHNSVTITKGDYDNTAFREKRIVTMGRLHPQKNQRMLIDAYAKAGAIMDDYIVEIYGDGPLYDDLQKHIAKLGLQNRILIIPSQPDIFRRIRNASLFVLTSDYEGMPNALMEAMALGLPCISTDCRPGGARTLIKDGINGYIVPCHDVAALSEKMAYVLGNEIIAKKISNEAVGILTTHTPQMIFEKWDNFLYSVTND